MKGKTGRVIKLNNFKEWLSDNLRYFLLGFFVLLILVAAFFGIRFASAKLGNQPKPDKSVQTTPEATLVVTKEPEQEEPSEVVATPTPSIETPSLALEKNVYPQVNAIIQKYYKALGDKDIQGIKNVVDELDTTDEAKITNDQYMDGYSNVEIYTKPGLEADDYVVLARYNYKFKDIDKLVPGLSQLYVRKKGDGSLYIPMQEQSEQIQQHVTTTLQEEDVQALIQEVKEEYSKAQEEDESLRNFIANLGVARSAAATAESGATVTIRSNCNMRATADASGEVMEQLAAGTQVTKTGTQGEWLQISHDGKTGYVRSDLFE